MGFINDAERRQRIMDGAVDCLAERGWSGTTMAAIAEKVGISRALISYHFDSKDALISETFAAIVRDIYGRGFAAMDAAAAAEPTAAGALHAYISTNIAYLIDHPNQVRAVNQIMPNLRNDDGSVYFDSESEEPVLQATARIFQRGQSAGEFGSFDTHAAAFTLRRAIDGAAARFVADPSFDLLGYGHELAEFFVRGSLATKGASSDPGKQGQ